eukprot:gene6333-6567_t
MGCLQMYLGSSMLLVVCDPDVARRLNYKMINRQIGNQLRLGKKDDQFTFQGLVAAKDEEWRTLRLAWQPAFQSGSLEGYCDLMDSCAAHLAERLKKQGESGQVVEMWRELGRMTLQVVGSTAYGVDFHTMPDDASSCEEVSAGVRLMQACQTVFSAGGLSRGSVYLLLNAMFPKLPLVSWLARNFPDKRLVTFVEARNSIRDVSSELIGHWRHDHSVEVTASAGNGCVPAAVEPTMADGSAPSTDQPIIETISATVDPTDRAPAGPHRHAGDDTRDQAPKTTAANQGKGVRRAAGLGIQPGSFLGLMLSARNRASGNHLTDVQVIAQSNTFILAGYETTANTLLYCVYNIAAHPKVQERLLQEIDAYGRHRKVAYADVGQFPYTEAIVRESLRLYPPATLLNREIKEGGFDVAPGIHAAAKTSVFTFVYGYQRDPDYWPAAEEFLPERWLPEGAAFAPTTPDAWTPFGSGPRMCVGWRFALQEAKIALIRLYQQQTYELEPGQVPLVTQQSITLSPKYGVKVQVVARP